MYLTIDWDQNLKSKDIWVRAISFGAIQKPRGQDFDHFWLPTYLDMDIFYPKRGQNEAFFDHLPTLSFPRSFWTTTLEKYCVKLETVLIETVLSTCV